MSKFNNVLLPTEGNPRFFSIFQRSRCQGRCTDESPADALVQKSTLLSNRHVHTCHTGSSNIETNYPIVSEPQPGIAVEFPFAYLRHHLHLQTEVPQVLSVALQVSPSIDPNGYSLCVSALPGPREVMTNKEVALFFCVLAVLCIVSL